MNGLNSQFDLDDLSPIGCSLAVTSTAADVTSALLKLGSLANREPIQVTNFLDSLPVSLQQPNGRIALWLAKFPFVLLKIVSDEPLYHPFAIDTDQSTKATGSLTISESSGSALVLNLVQLTIIRFNELLRQARRVLNTEHWSQVRAEVKQFLQRLPSFFEILWRHRHVVFSATPWSTIRPMLTDVQQLIQIYSDMYMDTNRSSMLPIPPLTSFVAHLGLYCWYNSNDTQRRDYGMPSYISPILQVAIAATPERCITFPREAIYPVFGSSPIDAIGRILTKDYGLTDTALLYITVELVLRLITLEPSMVKNVRDCEVLLLALATAAQRHVCQCLPEMEARRVPQTDDLLQKQEEICISILQIVWLTKCKLRGNTVQQVIIDHFRHLNFLPQLARGMGAQDRMEHEPIIIRCITFFVDIYRTIGDREQRGHLTRIQSAEYSNFRRGLQVHWQPIMDVLQKGISSAERLGRMSLTDFRMIRTKWRELKNVYKLDASPTEHFRNEQEMLGCFNVECPCYGHKPIHKLGGKCRRCQVAQYCSRECQKRDWKARHRAICSPL